MARVATQLARLPAMSPAELREEWERVYRSPPPLLTPALLRLGIAYRIQEKANGGLPASVLRELARVRAGGPAAPVAPASPTMRPGTKLVRTWRGRTIEVLVEEDGFLFNGERHPSLTSIAKAVTGAGWSGPRFFGLTCHA